MNILFFFLILIIGLPVLEIYFLIEVGSIIGALPTIAMTLFTAIAGIYLIRIQGLYTVQKMQASMQQGQVPAIELIEGVMLFIAALMLLIPGFFTDTVGFILLIPPLRTMLAKLWIANKISTAQMYKNQHADYIDGDYEDLSNKEQNKPSIENEKIK